MLPIALISLLLAISADARGFGRRAGRSSSNGDVFKRASGDSRLEARAELSTRALSWSLVGCYVDGDPRVLPTKVDVNGVTPASCQAACESRGFTFAGVQYSSECWCGNSIPSNAQTAPASDCTSSCSGDGNIKLCGGSYRENIYRGTNGGAAVTTTAAAVTTTTAAVSTGGNTLTYLGCYEDGNPRILNGYTYTDGQMTTAKCATTCRGRGFSFMDTQYGSECWCGSAAPAASLKRADSDCSSTCSGDSSAKCGGSYRGSVYQISGNAVVTTTAATTTAVTTTAATTTAATTTAAATTAATTTAAASNGSPVYLGCYEDSGNPRILGAYSFTDGSMTTAKCAAECSRRGYAYMDTQYSQECWCGNTQPAASLKRSDSDCSSTCNGDRSQICGGSYRGSVYRLSGSSAGTTAAGTTAATTTSSTTTSAATTAAATTAASNGSPVYLGCYEDGNPRILSGYQYTDGGLTNAKCATECKNRGFAYMDTQYGQECWCGNTAPAASLKRSDSDCSSTCAGDRSQICGGSYRGSVYQLSGGSSVSSSSTTSSSTTTTSSSTTTTSATPTGGNVNLSPYTGGKSLPQGTVSLGCFSDSTSSRHFTGPSYPNWSGITPSNCISWCKSQGNYLFAGGENSNQCWCSNTLDWSRKIADAQCNGGCAGDNGFACGGDTKLTVYSANTDVRVGTPSPPSSGRKYLWAHHIVGLTWTFNTDTWREEINSARTANIDGFALNIGSGSWQEDRVNYAFQAAQSISSDFKLFISFDFTAYSCSSTSDAQTMVNLMARYKNNGNQAFYKGKMLVASFSGEYCRFGFNNANDGFNYVKTLAQQQGFQIYIIPSIFPGNNAGPDTYGGANNWIDGHMYWDAGWPTGSNNLDFSIDQNQINTLNSLGKGYMAAVSPCFFTYYGPPPDYNKNFIYRGDNWLLATRMEMLIANRDKFDQAEIVSWNDYGESHYVGPIRSDQPGSQNWVNGFPHTGWLGLINYYAQAFKYGSYPSAGDQLYLWSRPNPKAGNANSPKLSKPTRWETTDDNLYVVAILSSTGSVTVKSGGNTVTYASVPAGLNKFLVSSASGSIGASIQRNGGTVKSYDSGGQFQWTTNFNDYNYNYFVASA